MRGAPAPALLLALLAMGPAGPAAAQQAGFDCLPAPQGFRLQAIGPELIDDAEPVWSFGCWYYPAEGGEAVANAGVQWYESEGSCPSQVVYATFGDEHGDVASDTHRARAYYNNPTGDGGFAAMADLAGGLLAAAEGRALACPEGGGAAPGAEETTQPAGGEEADGGVDPAALAIAGGLILSILGGGTALLQRRARPPDRGDHEGTAPVVTIGSPGQGDAVGATAVVTGTVTGARMVIVLVNGGAVGTAPAPAGTFAVSVPVTVKRTAIMVEASNEHGAGRAAVHVYREDAPEWHPGQAGDHAEAERLQAESRAAAPGSAVSPPEAPRAPQVHTPSSHDDLVRSLGRPEGGETRIPAANLASLLPPDRLAVVSSIRGLAVGAGGIVVDTPLGRATGTLSAGGDGRLHVEVTDVPRIPRDPMGFDFEPMTPAEATQKAQEFLRQVNDRIPAGVRVDDVRLANGEIRITTVPR